MGKSLTHSSTPQKTIPPRRDDHSGRLKNLPQYLSGRMQTGGVLNFRFKLVVAGPNSTRW